MGRDVTWVRDAILGHLVKFPEARLSVNDLARVLGSNSSTVRRACNALYADCQLWRLEGEAVRYQVDPRYLRKLDD